MLQRPGKTIMMASNHTKAPNNLPTTAADLASEDMAAEADEPPDLRLKTSFTKTPCSAKQNASLLSKMIHTSESDSHVDEDDYAFYEPHRATSSASTYSRGSAVSVTDLASDTALTSPHSLSQSIEQPLFKDQLVDSVKQESKDVSVPESKPEETLVKKRCITFACGSKAPKPKANTVTPSQKPPEPAPAESKRACMLKFICPTRDGATKYKPHVRLSSPPPPAVKASSPQHRQHRDSDATLRTNSPKIGRKLPVPVRARRGSTASNASHGSAIRFHEFASSEGEEDDWVKESTCYQARLTIDDTLVKEHNLRKLAKEAEEEEDEDELDEDDNEDEEAIEDDDEAEDVDDEDADSENDDSDNEVGMISSVHSAVLSDDVDEGFQTDDELGFAHSDDEDDANPDYDWWAPTRSAPSKQSDLNRPNPMPRRTSDSSIESRSSADRGIPISPHVQRKLSRATRPDRGCAPELPDSTDFVCGTLDEDRPLEQAYLNHLHQRRAAKHKAVPQDIDPTFPTSDPEIDEEDEDSDHVATESDAHLLVHGEMTDEDERSRRAPIRRRSPIASPRRLRSPAPAKRNVQKRSPPPPAARRARSPAPCALFHGSRLSSSMPRRGSSSQMRERFDESIVEEDDNTPRFNRQAVDIVMGLERKRARRREKLYEKHCRKAAKGKDKKEIKRGKGAEKMRDLGIGLNEYRGRKHATPTQPSTSDVHMLSY